VSLAVDRILDRRSRRESRRPEVLSVAAAALLHGAGVALVLLLPRLPPPPPPLAFVPVQIIPAQALGVRKPISRPQAEKPAPPKPAPAAEEPPEPEPPAPKPERPQPKPTREEVPQLPDKPAKKPEKPQKAASATPKPAAPSSAKPSLPKPPAAAPPAPSSETGGEAGRRGAPTGSAQGTSAFGSQIAGLDNPDFKFNYYIDQLLSAIDSKWVRPPLGNDVKTVISFRIERDGSLTDLQVAQSSGYNSFDLAALRAVQNASPFPPLPRAYRQDSLGVNLIVR
jgi:TonB family protein